MVAALGLFFDERRGLVVVVGEGGSVSSEAGKRRGQSIERARRRRRRPNIDGAKVTVEVVFSEEEFAKVQQFALEAECTVPWYLVQAAVDPTPRPAQGSGAGPGKPWLSWPRRLALSRMLMEAANMVDRVRLEQLAKIGGHFNQIARASNMTGVVGEEVLEASAELQETLTELRERVERIEALAQEVTRR